MSVKLLRVSRKVEKRERSNSARLRIYEKGHIFEIGFLDLNSPITLDKANDFIQSRMFCDDAR